MNSRPLLFAASLEFNFVTRPVYNGGERSVAAFGMRGTTHYTGIIREQSAGSWYPLKLIYRYIDIYLYIDYIL